MHFRAFVESSMPAFTAIRIPLACYAFILIPILTKESSYFKSLNNVTLQSTTILLASFLKFQHFTPLLACHLHKCTHFSTFVKITDRNAYATCELFT